MKGLRIIDTKCACIIYATNFQSTEAIWLFHVHLDLDFFLFSPAVRINYNQLMLNLHGRHEDSRDLRLISLSYKSYTVTYRLKAPYPMANSG
jgi:hypothetical protein